MSDIKIKFPKTAKLPWEMPLRGESFPFCYRMSATRIKDMNFNDRMWFRIPHSDRPGYAMARRYHNRSTP